MNKFIFVGAIMAININDQEFKTLKEFEKLLYISWR